MRILHATHELEPAAVHNSASRCVQFTAVLVVTNRLPAVAAVGPCRDEFISHR
jgi:hypothetical protein